MNENELARFADIRVPSARTPQLEEMQIRVASRRRFRRIAKFGGVATVVVMLGFVATAWNRPVTTSPYVGQLNQPAAPPTQAHESMRIMARVVQPEPIFEVDPDSQSVVHVGWIERQFMVPVQAHELAPELRQQASQLLDNDVQFVSF